METSKRSSSPTSKILLNHDDTKLRLGLPGTIDGSEKQQSQRKRSYLEEESTSGATDLSAPPPKTHVVGWPPVRSFRKNLLDSNTTKKPEKGIFVKVSMDGAPYLRKIDLKVYKGYQELLKSLEEMFEFKSASYSNEQGCIKGSEFETAYEDKDGDWMLVGDVPFEMFVNSCKRLRIMKGSACC